MPLYALRRAIQSNIVRKIRNNPLIFNSNCIKFITRKGFYLISFCILHLIIAQLLEKRPM